MYGTELCECRHGRKGHGSARCAGSDSYGIRCECRQFVLDVSDEDDDFNDYPGHDPNDHVQRRNIALEDEFLHGLECANFYSDPNQWRHAE